MPVLAPLTQAMYGVVLLILGSFVFVSVVSLLAYFVFLQKNSVR